MNVYIDGDSCKKEARDIIIKRALKEGFQLIVVADRTLRIPLGENILFVQVEPSPDAADRYIGEHVSTSDLVVTRDIPFAAHLVGQNITVINDRGVLFTSEMINARLKERDEALKWRNLGLADQGGVTYSQKDKQAFANGFDRILSKLIRN